MHCCIRLAPPAQYIYLSHHGNVKTHNCADILYMHTRTCVHYTCTWIHTTDLHLLYTTHVHIQCMYALSSCTTRTASTHAYTCNYSRYAHRTRAHYMHGQTMPNVIVQHLHSNVLKPGHVELKVLYWSWSCITLITGDIHQHESALTHVAECALHGMTREPNNRLAGDGCSGMCLVRIEKKKGNSQNNNITSQHKTLTE